MSAQRAPRLQEPPAPAPEGKLPAQTRAAVERLIAKCDADPWAVEGLDFTAPPPHLSAADEATVVQYLTDFQHIERMAGAFFAALATKVDDPSLVALLARFVADEERHAQALARLAAFHNRRRLRRYTASPTLVRLAERLHAWIALAPADAAAIGVTVGEIAFDIAYLGPLELFLSDPTTQAVLARIHRDEARHLALDYLLLDVAPSLAPSARSGLAVGQTLRLAGHWARIMAAGFPFMRTAFFGTNARLDPSGQRMRDAARRIQLAMDRPAVRDRVLGRAFAALQLGFDAPGLGRVLRGAFAVALNTNPEFFRCQATPAERAAARRSSADEAAQLTWAGFAHA